ncbi:MAG: cation diffusion facilitator family transporter [Methanobacteriaceae archaeon]|nr:cation diffusion facilitator family transporter [Methanobacteriaceae archaeon]
MMDQSYYSTVQRILLIILALNLAVAFAKLIYGWSTNSLSMVSDGFHSLFDGTSNVIGIIGIMIASRPPDLTHPYGHSKFETFASIGIALLLFITCFEIFQSAIGRFFNPAAPDITIFSFLIMGVTIAVNLTVSRYEHRKGKELDSSILIADSMHTRSDVYASLMVIVGFILIKMGFGIADPLISIFISILIARMGLEIIKSSSDVLLDRAPLDDELIKKIVCSVEGVRECHKVRSRGEDTQIYVDLHLTLNVGDSLNEAHLIAHEVENKLKNSIPGIKDVVIHMDPGEDQ